MAGIFGAKSKGTFTLATFVGDNASDSDRYCTYLGHLGWRNKYRTISIFVTLPKAARVSTINCDCLWCYCAYLRQWKHSLTHRYQKNIDCLSFVVCPPLAPHLRRHFLQWPLTVLIRQTRQAVQAINQSIFP